ncbi:MAG: SO_0444 family Cu/Zn efflux transporter [Cyclobacteriaceae bacterium]|nr:SO_0444 family Cu/Zn efflux transporter [Cyclobacteriaceae bacterium]
MIQNWILDYFEALIELTIEMAPYLLLGFFIAGLLHVFVSPKVLNDYIGKKNTASVIRAALAGIPLPLCSCGVIPTGISLFRNGAARGPVVSFMISTPQIAVDSVLVTYSMLGLPMAILRIVAAFISGIAGGLAVNKTDKHNYLNSPESSTQILVPGQTSGLVQKWIRVLKYAFVDFLSDIADWLLIGLLLAALMAVLIPDGYLQTHMNTPWLNMFIVLIASIPLYVCATGSVPIATVLLLKGLNPGAIVVFLMAGPATNAATIAIMAKTLGKKTLAIYMATMIAGSLLFGLFADYLLPGNWFYSLQAIEGQIETAPSWPGIVSALFLSILIVYGLWLRYCSRPTLDKTENKKMQSVAIKVKGMDCNHCKTSVEEAIKKLPSVKYVFANINSGIVEVSGNTLNEDSLIKAIRDSGYDVLNAENKKSS